MVSPIFCIIFPVSPLQDENLQRCSVSVDSHIENSESEDSTDDENLDMKDTGYHDAENEVDPDTDDDTERVLSGKLSESSGYAGSDLYEYKVIIINFHSLISRKNPHLCWHRRE